MVWEKIQIVEDNALGTGDSGDLDVKLPRNRAIAQLVLTVRNKNGTTSNTTDDGELNTVISAIEEIKVVAGSRIFKDYSGEACRDWATYRNGRMPFFHNTQVLGGTYPVGFQEAIFPIDFQRFAYDRVCGLPAPLYDSLDLKVKYDFEVSATAGFVAGQHKFDLYAELFPPMDKAALSTLKIIEQRKKIDHTSAASGTEPVDLSIDPKKQLRQVMVSCYKTAIAEGTNVTKVAMEVNSAEICTDDWNRWQWQNAMDCRLKYLQMIDDVHLDDASMVLQCKVPNVEPQMVALTAGVEDGYLSTTADEITIAGGGATNDDDVRLALHSQVIPRCVFLDFDKDMSMRNMVSQDAQDLIVKLKQAGAGSACEIHEMSICDA